MDAAVSITEADEATVIVADGTENTLTDGSTRNGYSARKRKPQKYLKQVIDDEVFVANAART